MGSRPTKDVVNRCWEFVIVLNVVSVDVKQTSEEISDHRVQELCEEEVDVLGSPSLTVGTVSVDVKQHSSSGQNLTWTPLRRSEQTTLHKRLLSFLWSDGRPRCF